MTIPNLGEIKKLKDKIEYILREYPKTRNSDIRLTIELWKRFHRSSLVQNKNGSIFVPLENLFELPREDNIKRVRAKTQNVDLKYLPTNWEIAKKRGIQENVWRKAMGYPPKFSTANQETLFF